MSRVVGFSPLPTLMELSVEADGLAISVEVGVGGISTRFDFLLSFPEKEVNYVYASSARGPAIGVIFLCEPGSLHQLVSNHLHYFAMVNSLLNNPASRDRYQGDVNADFFVFGAQKVATSLHRTNDPHRIKYHHRDQHQRQL